MGSIGEKLLAKRFRYFTPNSNDLPTYTEKEFEKQMNLEIMTIDVNDEDYRQRGFVYPRHYRKMERKEDEAGKFKQFNMDLQELSNQFSRDFDEVLELFH